MLDFSLFKMKTAPNIQRLPSRRFGAHHSLIPTDRYTCPIVLRKSSRGLLEELGPSPGRPLDVLLERLEELSPTSTYKPGQLEFRFVQTLCTIP